MVSGSMGSARLLAEAITGLAVLTVITALEWIAFGWRRRIACAHRLVETMASTCRWKGTTCARAVLTGMDDPIARLLRESVHLRSQGVRWDPAEFGRRVDATLWAPPGAAFALALGLVTALMPPLWTLRTALLVLLAAPAVLFALTYISASFAHARTEIHAALRQAECMLVNVPSQGERRIAAVLRPWGFLPGEEIRRGSREASVATWARVTTMDYLRR